MRVSGFGVLMLWGMGLKEKDWGVRFMPHGPLQSKSGRGFEELLGSMVLSFGFHAGCRRKERTTFMFIFPNNTPHLT